MRTMTFTTPEFLPTVGTAGSEMLVATCAAPGVNRLIVIGSSLTGDEASAAEVETVIASLALLSA